MKNISRGIWEVTYPHDGMTEFSTPGGCQAGFRALAWQRVKDDPLVPLATSVSLDKVVSILCRVSSCGPSESTSPFSLRLCALRGGTGGAIVTPLPSGLLLGPAGGMQRGTGVLTS